jgi:molybdate transport system regulatory protein
VRLSYKIWLDHKGRAFGYGPAHLLEGVEHWGSLRKAAQELGMSYNKAWRIVHAAEQRLSFPLLDRTVGGSLGGGSHLTPEAQDLMRRYRAMAVEVEQVLDAVYEKHFGDWVHPGPAELPVDLPPEPPSEDDAG